MVNTALIQLGIPRSKKTEPEPLYVCPGCSNHMYSNNMKTQMQCLIKMSNISYIMTLMFEKDYTNSAEN
jgi:acetyl-CoA carboxylase beta subunit